MNKLLIILLFLLGMHLQMHSQIVSGEYFFDTAPAHGKATPFSVVAGGSVNHTMNIPTNSLSPGIHNLFIRVKNNQKVWSHYQGRMFYIMEPPPAVINSQITAAEWFVNTDPGYGKGTAIIVSAGQSVNTTIAIPQNLAPGFHNLFIRVKDNENHWSHYQGRMFYIMEPSVNVNSQIVGAEWFIDTDPGVGLGTFISISPGTTVSTTISVPQTVASGDHNLFIRVKNSEGKWSHYAKREFKVAVSGFGNTLNDSQDIVLLYPNPTNDNVTISAKSTELEELILTDLNGKKLSHHIISGNSYVLPVQHLSSGYYFVTIKTQLGTITKQFMKE